MMNPRMPTVDIHCHLLPQVDDGPRALGEALDMARLAVASGITHAVLTPHLHPGRWENTRSALEPAFGLFRRALRTNGIALELGLACEARIAPELLPLIERHEVPFLGELDGYRVLLLEFPHGHIPMGADKFAARLLQLKVLPLIAHPERNKDAMRSRDKLRVFEEMGCLFQLTAGALAGRFGESAARLALQLLESESTFVMASDAHNLEARTPDLRHGEAVAARVLGVEAARRLVHDNPWRIVRWHFEERPAAPAVPAGGPRVAAPVPAPVAVPVQSEQPPAGANAELRERLARVVRRELLDALRHQVAEHVLVALIRRLNRALDAELRAHPAPGTREPP